MERSLRVEKIALDGLMTNAHQGTWAVPESRLAMATDPKNISRFDLLSLFDASESPGPGAPGPQTLTGALL
jgi:hypothetical protein